MSRFTHYNIFKRFFQLLHLKKVVNQTPLPTFRSALMSNKNKFLVGSQICSATIISVNNNDNDNENEKEKETEDEHVENTIEDNLKDALEKGDKAILNLMDQLKEFVTIVSQEYRNCLKQQMEIIRRAASVGPMAETWDDIPQYRTLADELQKELNEYVTLFNTLGQMANENSLENFVAGSTENLDHVVVKFKEVEVIFQKEIEENKKMEKELLLMKRDAILSEIIN